MKLKSLAADDARQHSQDLARAWQSSPNAPFARLEMLTAERPRRCGAQQVDCSLSAVGATLRPRRRNRVSNLIHPRRARSRKGPGFQVFGSLTWAPRVGGAPSARLENADGGAAVIRRPQGRPSTARVAYAPTYSRAVDSRMRSRGASRQRPDRELRGQQLTVPTVATRPRRRGD